MGRNMGNMNAGFTEQPMWGNYSQQPNNSSGYY
jgi:hypothetical protein